MRSWSVEFRLIKRVIVEKLYCGEYNNNYGVSLASRSIVLGIGLGDKSNNFTRCFFCNYLLALSICFCLGFGHGVELLN